MIITYKKWKEDYEREMRKYSKRLERNITCKHKNIIEYIRSCSDIELKTGKILKSFLTYTRCCQEVGCKISETSLIENVFKILVDGIDVLIIQDYIGDCGKFN